MEQCVGVLVFVGLKGKEGALLADWHETPAMSVVSQSIFMPLTR